MLFFPCFSDIFYVILEELKVNTPKAKGIVSAYVVRTKVLVCFPIGFVHKFFLKKDVLKTHNTLETLDLSHAKYIV